MPPWCNDHTGHQTGVARRLPLQVVKAVDEFDGEDPIIHVASRFPQGSFVKEKHNGSVDHSAFKASGAIDFRLRLQQPDVEFEERNIRDAGYQVFIYVPVGTKP